MKARIVLALVVLFILVIPSFADERTGPVGRMTVSAAAVDWQSSGSFDRLVLVVAAPNGTTITREFQGNRATFRVQDLAPRVVADGTYIYELRAIPKISDEVKLRLAAARAANDDDAEADARGERRRHGRRRDHPGQPLRRPRLREQRVVRLRHDPPQGEQHPHQLHGHVDVRGLPEQ